MFCRKYLLTSIFKGRTGGVVISVGVHRQSFVRRMKSKLTVLDLRAEVTSLHARLKGMRIANVYDLNAKTYMLKLARTDEKVFLLLESGSRFHTTNYTRDKGDTPNGFTMH